MRYLRILTHKPKHLSLATKEHRSLGIDSKFYFDCCSVYHQHQMGVSTLAACRFTKLKRRL